MHISNVSVASPFSQMQSMATGALAGASFGAQLTGQILPTMDASGFSAPSLAPSPLSATPSSQFAAGILSALFAAQQSPASAQTVAGGAHRRHHNHHVGADIGSDATDSTTPAAGAASTSSDAAADETTSNSGATAVQSAITAA